MAGNTSKVYVEIKGKDQSGKAFKSAQGRISSLGNSLKGLIGIYAALAGTKWIVKQADQYKLLNARLAKASKGLGTFKDNYRDLFSIANKTGSAFEDSVKLFESLARTAPDIGATRDHVLQMTESLQMMAVTSGATGEEIKNSMRQFSQAMAGGIVRAEEFNSIIENTPEIAAKIAEGMGMTVGKLRMAVVEGKVLSKDVFESILGQTDQIKSDFEKMPMTMDRSFTMIKNSAQKLIGVVFEAMGGPVGKVADGIATVSGWIDKLTNKVKNGGTIFKGFEAWAQPLSTAWGWVKDIGKALVWAGEQAFRLVPGALKKAFSYLLELPFIIQTTTIAIAVAYDKAWAHMKTGFLKAVNYMKVIWIKFKSFFLEKWRDAIYEMMSLLDSLPTDMFNPISDALADSVGSMTKTLYGYETTVVQLESANAQLTLGLDQQVTAFNDAADATFADVDAQWELYRASQAAAGATDIQAEGVRNLAGELKGAEEATKEYTSHWDGFVKGVRSSWTTMWEGLFTGKGIDSVKDFLDQVKDMFLKTLAKIAAQWTWSKLFGNLGNGSGGELGGIIGKVLGGGGSGIGSILGKVLGGGAAVGTSSGVLGGAGAAAAAGGSQISAAGELIKIGAGAGSGGGGIMGIGSKIISTLKSGFSGLSGGLGTIAGFAAPLSLAAFGFAQIHKRRKEDKKEFAALMADNTVRANMFLGEMTSGFKTIKQEGGKAWLQVSESMNNYMGQLDEAGSSKSKGHFLWHELVRVRDEFGNVIVRARDVEKLWNQINNSAPFLSAIEGSEAVASNMERMKNGVEGNAISEAFSLIAKGAGETHEVMRAMADGMIDATESVALGLGEAAIGTSENFRIMAQDALVVENGWKRMGQTGVDAILAIDQQSIAFRSAMEDNVLDQVEAVQFGLGYMGDIGRTEFESMVEWSMRASDTSAALGAITKVLGDEFIQLGAKAVQSLVNIDMAADPVKEALADGIVDAAEAAALGFEALGARSAEQFGIIVSAAQGATSHMVELRNAADNAAAAASRAAMSGNSKNGNGPRMDHFATGGQFTVGGRGGVDTNVVAFKATKGERVTVETPQQQKTTDGVEGTQALLSEIANSVRQADANNTRALERQRWAEAASNRH